MQIRAGETDRLLRRLALVAVPLVLGVPVGFSWLKLQARLRRDGRLDQLPGIASPGS